MPSHFTLPKTSNAMNLFGLFFALFASTMLAILLVTLFVIGE